MIGIYKITNKVNQKKYVGCSQNIEERFKAHIRNSKNKNSREYDKVLYRAFRKYGLDNFVFEIVEECSLETMFKREIFFIEKLCSDKDYNQTIGGDCSGIDNYGEKHGKSKLNEDDVIDIRNRYFNHERKKEVYKLYSHKIGESGFHKIWNGSTWTKTNMKVYTEENKKFHRSNTGNSGDTNGKSKLTRENVIDIRTRRKNGEKRQDVYKDYQSITEGSFKNLWYGYTWKSIIV